MIDTNLNGFIAAVNEEVNKQIEDMLGKADSEKKQKLQQAEDEILSKEYVKIRDAVTKLEAESKMIISKAEQEGRIKVLTHREELVKKIFSNVEEKLRKFVSSEKYAEFLSDLIKKESIEDGSIIYLKSDDMKYSQQLQKMTDAQCSFCEDKTIKYGGLSVYNEASSVLRNMTIDNLLEEEKKNFSSNYKLA